MTRAAQAARAGQAGQVAAGARRPQPTRRLAGLEALHRSAVHLARGTVPALREMLLDVNLTRP
jgi:hypothetical protein